MSAAGLTRKITWGVASGGVTLVRLDQPIEIATYPPLAVQDPPANVLTTFLGAGVPCAECRQVGAYHSTTVKLVQTDWWDLYYGRTMRSASLGGQFTWGDFGGSQIHAGQLVGVVVSGGYFDRNIALGDVISLSVADKRLWIRNTMAKNPAVPVLFPKPTCPVFLCSTLG